MTAPTLLAALLLPLAPLSAQAPRPNVLLILADDLGYSDLGCYGGEIGTPNLDALAKTGLRFTQCYDSTRCCPSRATLNTGLYPHQAGIGSFVTPKPDERRGPGYLGHLNDRCVTLAEVLRGAGYSTWMVGKWHMGQPGPIARGFDEFYGFTQGYEQDQWQPQRYVRLPRDREPERHYAAGTFYATDAFTDYALQFLQQARAQHKPWFLYIAHSAAHFPVQAPRASVERNLATYRRGWDVLRQERFVRMQASGLATDSWQLTPRSIVPIDRDDLTDGYSGQPNPAWDALPADRREDLAQRMAIYAAMVQHLDAGVGKLVADLQQHGEFDNTLILFLSDNGACYEWGPFGFDGPSRKRGETVILHQGEALAQMGGPGTYHAYGSAWANLCNTPFSLYKHFTHEGGIATALLAHWPNGIARAAGFVRDPVHMIDVMPTLCAIAGAHYPQEIDGRAILPMAGQSLLPLFAGKPAEERQLCFEHDGSRAIRDGRWKAVWEPQMPGGERWQLYDLQVDRCETHDLAADQPERTRQLADAWIAWARRVQVYPFFDPAKAGQGK